jgi:hypothetical protein
MLVNPSPWVLIEPLQAALFSAVVTTFVVQAATALQLDYAQVSASIALEQLAIQRAIATGSPIPDPLPSTLNMDSSTTSTSDRLVNGLWFTSLAFSLATTLAAMLVKQWIQEYVTPVSGTPQAQARVRQYRFLGFEEWNVPEIIGFLPYLLHLSLLLFLAGLVVFLFSLDLVASSIVAVITISSYSLYLVVNLLPVFSSQCPYKTPFSTRVYAVLYPRVDQIKSYFSSIKRGFVIVEKGALSSVNPVASIVFPNRQESTLPGYRSPAPPPRTVRVDTLRAKELRDIDKEGDRLDAKGLCWLTDETSNPTVGNIVIQAVGSLRVGFTAKDILREEGVFNLVCSRFGAFSANDVKLDPALKRHFDACVIAHIQLGHVAKTLHSQGFQ